MFALIAPFAFGLLFLFAAHIDPLSGRWRAPFARRRKNKQERATAAFTAYSESPSSGS